MVYHRCRQRDSVVGTAAGFGFALALHPVGLAFGHYILGLKTAMLKIRHWKKKYARLDVKTVVLLLMIVSCLFCRCSWEVTHDVVV